MSKVASNIASIEPETILSVTEKTNFKELCGKLYNHPQFKWIIVFILFIIGLYFFLVVNKKSSICPFNNTKQLKIRKLDKKLLVESEEDSDDEDSPVEIKPKQRKQVKEKVAVPTSTGQTIEYYIDQPENNRVDELLNSSEEDLNLKTQDLTTEEMREIDEQLEEI